MSVSTFIPTLWAARILANLNNAHVFVSPDIANRDYEGDIRQMGDKVKINSIGRITIRSYTRGSAITAPETLNTASQEIEIDQGKYFNFEIDDVDRAQAQNGGALMEAAMVEAGWGLSDQADQFIVGKYAEVPAGNTLGTIASPISITGSNAYDYLVKLGVKLDNNNTPRDGRWVVVPPWFYGAINLDSRFVAYGTAENRAQAANGVVGQMAGFQVRMSNNVQVVSSTKYQIMAGWRGAVSFAEQILNMEAYRPPDKFSDAVKGLYVYGGKVVRPANVALLIATDNT
jgi:hypothetical protein